MKPMPFAAWFNPFLIWSELAWKSAELMLTSARVIGHRTQLMAAAGHRPSASHRRELDRMWQEKLAAAAESGLATSAELMKMHLALGTRAVEEMLRLTMGAWEIALSASAPQRVLRQQRMFSDAVARSLAHTVHLSESSGRLATRALKPVHRRVSSNAKRLAGKR